MARPDAQRCCIYRALLSRCVADEDTWKLCVVRNDRLLFCMKWQFKRRREFDLRDTFPFKGSICPITLLSVIIFYRKFVFLKMLRLLLSVVQYMTAH